MSKTIVSIILVVAVIIVGWLLLSHNKKTSGMNDNQQKVIEKILADGKVKTVTTKEGSGPESKIGDRVSMNYTGKLIDGTVFDSNVDPAFEHVKPYVFVLGEGRVIQGWELGVLGMKKGEKRTLTIDPQFAYGSAGVGRIPPNATLIFDVELVAIDDVGSGASN